MKSLLLALTVIVLSAGAALATNGDTLVQDGWALPRSHTYWVYESHGGSSTQVDVTQIPDQLAKNKFVYDRTANVTVNDPANGFRNPMYLVASTNAGTSGGGTWLHVHGNVVTVQGSALTFRADDGRTLNVDMTQVNAQVQRALTPNEGATLIGFQGATQNIFQARYIQQDSSNPARGGRIYGRTPAPTTTQATPSTSSTASVDTKAWQRIHGTIQSLSGATLTLKADDGRMLTVDTSNVNPQVQHALTQGEDVTVIGHFNGDQNHVVAQFVQQRRGAGSASPKTKK
jgi:outer membrane lipoprotein SlyB